ncbi:MAG TPA: endolytic transglycosylase MltG [Bacilli bacterium]
MEEAYKLDCGRRRLRNILIVLASLLLLAAGCLAGVALYVANALQPMEPTGSEVHVQIEKGMDTRSIADALAEHGIIRDSFIFTLYVKYKHEGSRFQAGEYAMKPGIKLDDIIQKLNSGDTVKAATVRFTIPEGYTVEQIADKLGKLGIVNKEKFLALAKKPELFSAKHIGDIPKNPALKEPLEGYLFPETYEMKKGSTEQEIIERMLQELDRKLDTLPADWQSKMQKNGVTFHQLLTIASLIEREAVLPEERPIISSVIYNRLHNKQPMPLQIDATIQYALGKQKEKLYADDLKVDSPYNTYLHLGLPPGPIADPSLASIKAALEPASTKYYYYVTRKDGSNGHYFAKDFNEHKANRLKSEKNAANRGN